MRLVSAAMTLGQIEARQSFVDLLHLSFRTLNSEVSVPALIKKVQMEHNTGQASGIFLMPEDTVQASVRKAQEVRTGLRHRRFLEVNIAMRPHDRLLTRYDYGKSVDVAHEYLEHTDYDGLAIEPALSP